MGGTGAVGAQHHLIERLAGSTCTCTRRRASRPRPPRPWRVGDRRRAPRAPARSTIASAQPAARRSPEVGGPATSTSSTIRPGATMRWPRRCPGCGRPAGPRDRRRPRRRRPAAAWGRGARRPRGQQHPHRPAVLVGQRPGGVVTMLCRLPPKAPPLASGECGLAPRLAPRRIGFEVGGFDPGGAQRRRPVAGGHASGGRASTVVRRPCTLPAAARASARVSPTAHPPVPSGTATRASRGAVSSANRPARARRPVPPAGAPLPRSSARAVAASRSRRARPAGSVGDVPGIEDRAPAGAPAEVGEKALLHRRVIVRRVPFARSPSSRQMMPGVQKPHWLAPVAQKASAHRARSSSGEPVDGRDRPPRDPAHGGHARDPGLAVHQHGAATALTLRAAPVLRRPKVQ